MHGIPNAIRAQSTTGRVFWCIVCCVSAAIFSLQLTQLLQKYFAFPKKVVIEVVPLSVPFPSISLCNLRNLDNIVLNRLNNIFKTDWDIANFTSSNEADNDTDGERDSHVFDSPFIAKYLETVAKYYPMYTHNVTDNHAFETVVTRSTLATNIDMKILADAGVPFKEFIVTCRFGGIPCSKTRDFEQFFDSYYYNCFTYNAPTNIGFDGEGEEDRTLAEGLENGWSTVVLTGSSMLDRNEPIRKIPGTHEYVSPMSSSEGVRVVIHPPNTEPYPHTEGFDVPPGYSASFGVKSRQNIRIGPPYGNCSEGNPFQNDERKYRLISCQKHCLQQAIVRACQCKDISLPGAKLHPDVR